MKLRDYQEDAVDRVVEALQPRGASTLGIGATGLGKTVILSHVADRFLAFGRVLILAHRAELVRQACEKAEDVTGQRAEIEMASDRADQSVFGKAPIVVASRDTLAHRMRKFRPKDFSLIITDEAHHAPAARYQSIYTYFRQANEDIRHFGATATAHRLDGVGLKSTYDSVAFNYDIRFGIENGWLVDIRQVPVYLGSIDLTSVRRSGDDMSLEDLDREMTKQKPLWGQAEAIVKESRWRKALVFTVTVHHATLLAKIINELKPGSAAMICGNTPSDQRAETLAAFRRGEIQYLVNVDVLTEGFDEPSIEMVAICRPTKSRAKYVQMLGRGTRVLPGVVDEIGCAEHRLAAIARSRKKNLSVLDFVGVAGEHKLVSSMDVLAGHLPEPVRREMKKLRDDGMVGTTRDMAEAAQASLDEREEERKRQAEKRVEGMRARVEYSIGRAISPFNILDIRTPPVRHARLVTPPTERQTKFLRSQGVDVADLSRGDAGRLVGEIKKRIKSGMPTYKQERLLKRHRVSTEGMTKESASHAIDMLMRGAPR